MPVDALLHQPLLGRAATVRCAAWRLTRHNSGRRNPRRATPADNWPTLQELKRAIATILQTDLASLTLHPRGLEMVKGQRVGSRQSTVPVREDPGYRNQHPLRRSKT